MLKSLQFAIFNLIESIHHFSNQNEVELIKNTGLFAKLDPQSLALMLKATQSIKYTKDTLIMREGEQGDALYIIAKGSVRVFTYDAQKTKIALARLNQGDYFGEQALLGEANKTRNANIETITDTTLLKINEKFILHSLRLDKALKAKLQKIGYQQALHALSLTARLYNEINTIIAQIKHPLIKEFGAGNVIFSCDENSDNVYVILQGEVELLFPNKVDKKVTSLTLHQGQMFGELGLLRNQPRAATAIAHSNLRLLVIPGTDFKGYLDQHPQSKIEKLLLTFQHAYQLPAKGIVEQFSGNDPDMGTTITNIFKLDDGRSIISAHYLSQDVFLMSTSNVTATKSYHYTFDPQHKVELNTANHKLIEIKAYGWWDDLSKACGLLLDGETLTDNLLDNFEKTGDLAVTNPNLLSEQQQIICDCLLVKRYQIQDLIDRNIRDFETISTVTGACTVCRCCKYRILVMLGENPWMEATITKLAQHNDFMASYMVQPINAKFTAWKPGQFIVLQAKIRNNWVERSYTMSDVQHDNGLRITIKKEAKGLFSSWLFDEAPQEFNINILQPQGQFILDLDKNTEALCFAGGVGITPFITYAKLLAEMGIPKRLHIIYCALSQSDFIFRDEFDHVISIMPTITISYRATNTDGFLRANDIIDAINALHEPSIYICGPEGFEQLMYATLNKIKYDPLKIHSEQFSHAGMGSTKEN